MFNLRKMVPLIVLTALTAGALVGCPVIMGNGNTLSLENYSTFTMREANFRVSGDTDWGADQLRGASLPGNGSADAKYTVTNIPSNVYDLRALFNTTNTSLTGTYTVYQYYVPLDGAWRWIFALFTAGSVYNPQTGEWEPAEQAVVDTLVLKTK